MIPITVDVEHAIESIIRFLLSPPDQYKGPDNANLRVSHAMHQFLIDVHHITDSDDAKQYFFRISPAFFDAAWELCCRGILRPGEKCYEIGRHATHVLSDFWFLSGICG